MALNAYVANTALLLQNPAAPTQLYSTANLTTFVNTARNHIAGETQCCRVGLTLTTTGGVNAYTFQSTYPSFPYGIMGLFNIRQMWVGSGSGKLYMGSRPYPWAAIYWLNNSSPTQSRPTEWSQYIPGSNNSSGVGGGSFYVNPTPDTTYTLYLDASGMPSVLTNDTDPEYLSSLYTDAVPYLAAYYAYMSAQRQEDAQTMLQRYQDFINRAKSSAVPNVLPMQYDQSQPPPAQGGAAASAPRQGGG